MGPDQQPNLDQLLDEALQDYGAVEPRMGLEGRVLASLRAEGKKISAERRWWWALGAVVAVLAIMAGLSLGNRSRSVSGVADSSPRERIEHGARTGEPQALAGTGTTWQHPDVSAMQCGKLRPALDRRTVSAEKRERFPAARPLSEQEKMLLAYVNKTPQEELVVVASSTGRPDALKVEELKVTPLDVDRPLTSANKID